MHGGLEVQGGVAERLIGGRVAHLLQVVEMPVGVSGLTLGGVAEVAGDLGIALHVGDLREVHVAAVRHRLAGERVLQVLVGLRSLQLSHRLSFLVSGFSVVPSSRGRAPGGHRSAHGYRVARCNRRIDLESGSSSR